ncbi:MAG: DMT family transporter [Clostridia bacterium]|nr:DMT family transporter [Clostridia bacterium]
MKKNNLMGSSLLCLAALLWGLAFVVQDTVSDKIPPFIFNSIRSFVGAAFLLGFMGVMSIKNKDYTPVPKSIDKKKLLIGSTLCGLMLAISTNLQQFGITLYPDDVPNSARSGFLTALYVIIVPILSVFVRKKVPIIVWLSSVVAVIGFYMLCLFNGVSGFYFADILLLCCALTFSLHIIVIDRYCGAVGGVRLSAFQFIVSGILSGVLALIFELDTISIKNIIDSTWAILYMGVVSSGIAYTLQIVGQKYAEPSIASITMSLESVFAALGGWVIKGAALEVNEIVGCLLVFGAIILAQTPELLKKRVES